MNCHVLWSFRVIWNRTNVIFDARHFLPKRIRPPLLKKKQKFWFRIERLTSITIPDNSSLKIISSRKLDIIPIKPPLPDRFLPHQTHLHTISNSIPICPSMLIKYLLKSSRRNFIFVHLEYNIFFWYSFIDIVSYLFADLIVKKRNRLTLVKETSLWYEKLYPSLNYLISRKHQPLQYSFQMRFLIPSMTPIILGLQHIKLLPGKNLPLPTSHPPYFSSINCVHIKQPQLKLWGDRSVIGLSCNEGCGYYFYCR